MYPHAKKQYYRDIKAKKYCNFEKEKKWIWINVELINGKRKINGRKKRGHHIKR